MPQDLDVNHAALAGESKEVSAEAGCLLRNNMFLKCVHDHDLYISQSLRACLRI